MYFLIYYFNIFINKKYILKSNHGYDRKQYLNFLYPIRHNFKCIQFHECTQQIREEEEKKRESPRL